MNYCLLGLKKKPSGDGSAGWGGGGGLATFCGFGAGPRTFVRWKKRPIDGLLHGGAAVLSHPACGNALPMLGLHLHTPPFMKGPAAEECRLKEGGFSRSCSDCVAVPGCVRVWQPRCAPALCALKESQVEQAFKSDQGMDVWGVAVPSMTAPLISGRVTSSHSAPCLRIRPLCPCCLWCQLRALMVRRPSCVADLLMIQLRSFVRSWLKVLHASLGVQASQNHIAVSVSCSR